MDFSESYKCSLLPVYSPDGCFIAAAVEYRLVIREVESLKVVQIFSCLDKIHTVEWSANGKYVLCGLYDRGIVQIWAVEDPDWNCKIDEGPAGIKHCR
jgi:WD40 repeat protein